MSRALKNAPEISELELLQERLEALDLLLDQLLTEFETIAPKLRTFDERRLMSIRIGIDVALAEWDRIYLQIVDLPRA